MLTFSPPLCLAGELGVLTVLAAAPKWSAITSCEFGERITATPAIRDGASYVRTEDALYRIQQR